jgi:hypothetical protein
MSVSKLRVLPWTLVATNTTTAIFVPATDWELTLGVTGARAWGEIRCRNGLIQVQPAVQVTNDIRANYTQTGLSPTMTTDGVYDPSAAAAITSSGTSRYMRSGWLISLTSGNTLATAWVGGAVELQF